MFLRPPGWLETGLTYGPALVLAAVALRLWRSYWSMRFWLGAAVLYWLIPWGNRAIFNAANGAGIQREGVGTGVTHAFYALAGYSWLLLLLLMALGLLSFHPATRWVDTARYRNLVVAGAMCVIAAPIGGVGYYYTTDRRIIPPLNPLEYFKDRPLTTLIDVAFAPAQEVFESDPVTFRIALTNTGSVDIHLNELPISGVRFRRQPFFTCRRDDGQSIEWGEDLRIPPEHEVLRPAERREFPIDVRVVLKPQRDEDPFVLTPGDYTAFVTFFLQKQHTYEKAVSNVVRFRVAAPPTE